MEGQNAIAVTSMLNPAIRGGANDYRHVVSKEIFADLDSWILKREVRWARKTHPQKPLVSVEPEEVLGLHHPKRKAKWIFGTVEGGRTCKPIRLSWTPIERHVIVKMHASPDDPNLHSYWERRRRKRHEELPNGQKAVARRQKGNAPNAARRITTMNICTSIITFPDNTACAITSTSCA